MRLIRQIAAADRAYWRLFAAQKALEVRQKQYELAVAQLERLWCMYCRDTGDAATEHIKDLAKLKTYYAGASQITDRSLEILAQMRSLESIEFWQCLGITDAGVAHLATLPNLREITLGGLPGVTV